LPRSSKTQPSVKTKFFKVPLLHLKQLKTPLLRPLIVPHYLILIKTSQKQTY